MLSKPITKPHRPKRLMLLTVSVALLTSTGRAQIIDSNEDRWLDPLRKANISLTDPAALIRLLKGPDLHLASNAAYALGKLPKTKEAVDELTSAVRTEPPPGTPRYKEGSFDALAVSAAMALAQLNDKDWIPVGRARLASIKDRNSMIQMSGVLASQGCYDGWRIVHEYLTIVPFNHTSILAVPKFVGMKNADGTEFDVAAELERLIPFMGTHRELAATTVRQIRARTKH
jgi:hypothetical protein